MLPTATAGAFGAHEASDEVTAWGQLPALGRSPASSRQRRLRFWAVVSALSPGLKPGLKAPLALGLEAPAALDELPGRPRAEAVAEAVAEAGAGA